jgi:SAM-dependent methyltransferase
MDSETNLKKVSRQNNYIDWLYSEIKPFLGRNILEVGAGVGAFTKRLAADGRKVLPTDKHIYDLNLSGKEIENFDITSDPARLGRTFDTVVCINVLEHIKDDDTALRNMNSLLDKKGLLILMVPAFPFLYGTVDKANEHHRRYHRKDIMSKVRKTGFSIIRCKYINFVGLIGWIFQNKVISSRLHRDVDMARFNSICPLLRGIEWVIPPPIGLNIVLIAKK